MTITDNSGSEGLSCKTAFERLTRGLREYTQGTGHYVNFRHSFKESCREGIKVIYKRLPGKSDTKHLFSGFLLLNIALLPGDFLTEIKGALLVEPVVAKEAAVNTPVPAVVCDIKSDKAFLSTLDTVSSHNEVKNTEDTKTCERSEIIKNNLLTVPVAKEESFPEETTEEKVQNQQKEEGIKSLVSGHPLAEMAGEIANLQPEIGGLVVGIAKKESSWGKHSPRKAGKDCFNYWGFKGKGERGSAGEYACFATREEAVSKISQRLEKLVAKRGTSKPSALVTAWKCGNSCASHSKESVSKWVSDVDTYYRAVLTLEKS